LQIIVSRLLLQRKEKDADNLLSVIPAFMIPFESFLTDILAEQVNTMLF